MSHGWWKESARHSLAARGIKTSRRSRRIPANVRRYNSRIARFLITQIGSLGFSNFKFRVNGLKPSEYLADKGRTRLSAKQLDRKMKSQAKGYRSIYDDMAPKDKAARKAFGRRYANESSALSAEYDRSLSKKSIASSLSDRYKKYWLTSSGITKDNIDSLIARGKVSVDIVDSSDYDNLPEEKMRFSRGEMSYAQTKITPSYIYITIRNTPNEEVMQKLLQHELEELSAFKSLKTLGIKDTVNVAHELTKTKVTNEEVDRAYGDIGDPT